MPVVVWMLCEEAEWARDDFENYATEGEINVAKQEGVFRSLGQKIVWGGIELSSLVQMFYGIEKERELRQERGVVSD